jgi:hypothetical protein
VKYGRISPASGILLGHYKGKSIDSNMKEIVTGLIRSRNHQIAWLVMAGEQPNTSMGSQSTMHSHIDHKCGKDASNKEMGGGVRGVEEAKI